MKKRTCAGSRSRLRGELRTRSGSIQGSGCGFINVGRPVRLESRRFISPQISRMNTRIARAYEFADLSGYSFLDRWKIRAADWVFYMLINFIGRTARFEVIGWENHEKAVANGGLPIYVFWHDRIFLTTYWWRKRRIVVMTSRSFDGEYIARFIQRFGYGAV